LEIIIYYEKAELLLKTLRKELYIAHPQCPWALNDHPALKKETKDACKGTSRRIGLSANL